MRLPPAFAARALTSRGYQVYEAASGVEALEVLRDDFGFDELGTLMVAVANIIALHPDDDEAWRRHLGFVLDGIRRTPHRTEA